MKLALRGVPLGFTLVAALGCPTPIGPVGRDADADAGTAGAEDDSAGDDTEDNTDNDTEDNTGETDGGPAPDEPRDPPIDDPGDDPIGDDPGAGDPTDPGAGDPTDPGTGDDPGATVVSGALLYSGYYGAGHFDLGTKVETLSSLSEDTMTELGFSGPAVGGGTAIAEVEDLGDSAYAVHVLSIDEGEYVTTSSLPVFSVPDGYVVGPIQPSPDALRFAMHSRESASLNDPFVDFVTLFTSDLEVISRWQNATDPRWVDNDAVVVASSDELYRLSASAPDEATRIGPSGFARPGEPVSTPTPSADGTTLAFVQADKVWTIRLDGSDLRELTTSHIGVAWPAWSPDGTHIAIVARPCPPLGAGSPTPEIVLLSSTLLEQDPDTLAPVARADGSLVRSCGPLHWVQ